MQCVQCQYENASNAKFCNQCAAPFAPVCSACGHENTADAKFCNQCGTPLISPTSAPCSDQFRQQEAESEDRFYSYLFAVIAMLQRESRVTYRMLKHVFGVDEVLLEEIRRELAFKKLAIDEDEEGLVWIGETQLAANPIVSTPNPMATEVTSPAAPVLPPLVTKPTTETNGPTVSPENILTDSQPDESLVMPESVRFAPEAERRQLTVMFCDLVGSTDLSGKLDPEHLREVVKAYQETAASVIQQYEGYIAQYLGDGLLIYFGFPVAHEDDAQRAIYTGLEIPEVIANLNTRLKTKYGVELAVRIGIHTGPVVVGEMGGGGRHENLALGETPNIAARLEGLAQPNTAVISPITAQLVQRVFILEELGLYELKGVAEPMMLYAVVVPRESEHDDHGDMLLGGFDALVGREEEVGLLLRRWEQSKEGLGQVVFISGEAGIGKSFLVDGLRHHVHQEGLTRIAFRCSPYHTNSAFYPIIEHVRRALGWQPEDTADTQLAKLEQGLRATSLPLEEAVPLLASLLSLSLPEGRYPVLSVSPEQQRQQTQDVLVAWLLEEAERQAVLAVWKDLHWADPSTLENLGLLVEQAPTATMLHVLTFRPEFEPPWPSRSHLTPITLNRLERPQVEVLVRRLAGGKRLPEEVVAHIVSKTDGVPLYVEELTKMLLASDLLREDAEQYVLTGPLLTVAIPDTLQDSLMARLDQMNTAKEVAQLGSVLGREFAYDMLQALYWQDEETLQAALGQLVAAELLYQRGRPPRARYFFKHVLIRDAAYASLLRSTRQRVHQQIAQVLEAQFPEVVETQPELMARHCTEAGQDEAAISYWQRAGQLALQRSANHEAIGHLTAGLGLLAALPETPDLSQQELDFQMLLGPALMAIKGYGAVEVQRVYQRARQLCQEIRDPSHLFPVLRGLWQFSILRAELRPAYELAEQLSGLVQQEPDTAFLPESYRLLGEPLGWMGEFASAHTHLEQGLVAYHAQQSPNPAILSAIGLNSGVDCAMFAAFALWPLGYPDRAQRHVHAALRHAEELADPINLAFALCFSALLHQFHREGITTQEQAEMAIRLSADQGFTHFRALGTIYQGWALAMQDRAVEGLAHIRQGLTAYEDTGATLERPYSLALLAEVYGWRGETEMGLTVLAEALALVDERGDRWCEAELHRLQGELLLRQVVSDEPQAQTCFEHSLDIARRQEAKSWELRAATSLARLWQGQDKHREAYNLLAPVYAWFTEGFDTADLIEANQLLDELNTEKMPPTA